MGILEFDASGRHHLNLLASLQGRKVCPFYLPSQMGCRILFNHFENTLSSNFIWTLFCFNGVWPISSQMGCRIQYFQILSAIFHLSNYRTSSENCRILLLLLLHSVGYRILWTFLSDVGIYYMYLYVASSLVHWPHCSRLGNVGCRIHWTLMHHTHRIASYLLLSSYFIHTVHITIAMQHAVFGGFKSQKKKRKKNAVEMN